MPPLLNPSRQPCFISEGSYTISTRQHLTYTQQRHIYRDRESNKFQLVACSHVVNDSDGDRKDAAAAGQGRRRMIRWLTNLTRR